MKISRLAILFVGMVCAGVSFAQRTEVDLNAGEYAMQISLQKEVYGILISDTDEVQAEYKQKGVMYRNDKLAKYQKMFDAICASDKAQACPEIYFTTRTEQGIASMYPNGVLTINEEIARRINDNEAMFLLAHEYAHYKYNHSKQRMKVVANAIVENAIMIREPEQALGAAGFLPGVREAHYMYEKEADAYGFAYVTQQGIKLECENMFLKIAGGDTISNDKHDSVAQRCTHYKG